MELRGQYNKVIPEHFKVAEYDYDYMLLFFKETKTMYTKLVPETVPYIGFTSKFIWNHLSFYHSYHLSGIIYKSIFDLNITLNYWLNSKTIKYLFENVPWVLGILVV